MIDSARPFAYNIYQHHTEGGAGMEKGFTDIHTHILFGIDDGPKDEAAMLKMLRNAAEDGVRRIVATPHIRPGVLPFRDRSYTHALDRARALCQREGLDIEILPGAEMLYTSMTPFYLRAAQVPTLAGTRLLLTEFKYDISYRRLNAAIENIILEGYKPVLAHTERVACLRRHPRRCRKLKDDYGVYIQINCEAILATRGFSLRRFVRYVLKHRLADAVASDAHNTTTRATQMRRAHARLLELCPKRYADRLTDPVFLK